MFGMPLHPMIVHFPIVLAMILPVAALLAILAIRRGAPVRSAWAAPLALAIALAASSYVAVETGERDEDAAGKVVPRSALHEHEELSERFLILSGVLAVVAAAGLLPRTVGRGARILAAAGAVGAVAAVAQVGHLGGELVYRYGAASAYADSASVARRSGPVRP